MIRPVLLAAAFLWAGSAWAVTAHVAEGKRANLREGGGLDYPVITVLQPGTSLEVLKIGGDYAKVRLDSGKEGWIAGVLLEPDETPPLLNCEPVGGGETIAGRNRRMDGQVARLRAELAREKEGRETDRQVAAVLAVASAVCGMAAGALARGGTRPERGGKES